MINKNDIKQTIEILSEDIKSKILQRIRKEDGYNEFYNTDNFAKILTSLKDIKEILDSNGYIDFEIKIEIFKKLYNIQSDLFSKKNAVVDQVIKNNLSNFYKIINDYIIYRYFSECNKYMNKLIKFTRTDVNKIEAELYKLSRLNNNEIYLDADKYAHFKYLLGKNKQYLERLNKFELHDVDPLGFSFLNLEVIYKYEENKKEISELLNENETLKAMCRVEMTEQEHRLKLELESEKAYEEICAFQKNQEQKLELIRALQNELTYLPRKEGFDRNKIQREEAENFNKLYGNFQELFEKFQRNQERDLQNQEWQEKNRKIKSDNAETRRQNGPAAAAAAGESEELKKIILVSKDRFTKDNVETLAEIEEFKGENKSIKFKAFEALAKKMGARKINVGGSERRFEFTGIDEKGNKISISINIHEGHGKDRKEYLSNLCIKRIREMFYECAVFGTAQEENRLVFS